MRTSRRRVGNRHSTGAGPRLRRGEGHRDTTARARGQCCRAIIGLRKITAGADGADGQGRAAAVGQSN